MVENTIVRAFDGSLSDAEGLLAVEKATFDESPYSAQEIQALLNEGPQRAWLATAGGNVVGFAIAFVTNGQRGSYWEIDLLAVHADWTRRGLATRLIRAASAHGATVAPQARAVVAADNIASARAFRRAGFRAAPETCALLIFRPGEQELYSPLASDILVREASSVEIAGWSKPAGVVHEPRPVRQSATPPPHPQLASPLILIAEQNEQPIGYVELIQVQTLLYRGLWIESLETSTPASRAVLVHKAVEWTIAAGLDEIGALAPAGDRPLRQVLQAAGFRSLGDFFWFIARLPLPGLAQSTTASRKVIGSQSAGVHFRDDHA